LLARESQRRFKLSITIVLPRRCRGEKSIHEDAGPKASEEDICQFENLCNFRSLKLCLASGQLHPWPTPRQKNAQFRTLQSLLQPETETKECATAGTGQAEEEEEEEEEDLHTFAGAGRVPIIATIIFRHITATYFCYPRSKTTNKISSIETEEQPLLGASY
jgi:hypothetical protein